MLLSKKSINLPGVAYQIYKFINYFELSLKDLFSIILNNSIIKLKINILIFFLSTILQAAKFCQKFMNIIKFFYIKYLVI